ncbi:hypothetical protein PM082_007838 [Marasmius tenuissimus]|nr:hypothetical protein PM082_007838 [Marasmius tenuissimus]
MTLHGLLFRWCPAAEPLEPPLDILSVTFSDSETVQSFPSIFLTSEKDTFELLTKERLYFWVRSEIVQGMREGSRGCMDHSEIDGKDSNDNVLDGVAPPLPFLPRLSFISTSHVIPSLGLSSPASVIQILSFTTSPRWPIACLSFAIQVKINGPMTACRNQGNMPIKVEPRTTSIMNCTFSLHQSSSRQMGNPTRRRLKAQTTMLYIIARESEESS